MVTIKSGKKNKIKSLFIILQQRGADRNRNRFLQQTLACASAICLRAGADFSSFSRDVWVLQAPPSLSPPFSASPSSADKKQAVETRVERDKRRGHGKHPLFFFFFWVHPSCIWIIRNQAGSSQRWISPAWRGKEQQNLKKIWLFPPAQLSQQIHKGAGLGIFLPQMGFSQLPFSIRFFPSF